MTIPIISNPDDISVAWLNLVFASNGLGRVSDFSSDSIGTGQVGENVRFKLTGTDVPESVVGKFPSLDPVSRKTGIAQGNYLKEVFFYREIQATVDIQTPIVFFAAIEEATHDFVILMEDLAPGLQGEQLEGCSPDQAALALEQLARLQGPRWGDVNLASHPMLGGEPDSAADENLLVQFYDGVKPGYLQRYAHRLSQWDLTATDRLSAFLPSYQAIYANEPPVLIHVDYRLDNMMFGGPYPLTVIDWQSLRTGCPVADVSYFLGTSLLPEVRAKEERALLEFYLDVLRSYRVELGLDDCFRYYRNYAPAGMIMAVIASMIVGETPRGNDMFMAMATRSATMCRDLETF